LVLPAGAANFDVKLPSDDDVLAELLEYATIVVMMPMLHVPTNTARINPLIARKLACGLSASRRVAISVAALVVRRALIRERLA
jgi:hypothetical protein